MTETVRSTLYLLRHAHSSWALPGQRDHQRPLDARGREDALALEPRMLDAGCAIDTVVCSTATRAAQTFAALRPRLSRDVAVATSDDIYALGTDAYLAAARGQEGARGLLIVGHNPMIEEFTLSLAGSGETDALAALAEGFPTAGLAIVEFTTGLDAISAGSGHLRRLLRPRDHGG